MNEQEMYILMGEIKSSLKHIMKTLDEKSKKIDDHIDSSDDFRDMVKTLWEEYKKDMKVREKVAVIWKILSIVGVLVLGLVTHAIQSMFTKQ